MVNSSFAVRMYTTNAFSRHFKTRKNNILDFVAKHATPTQGPSRKEQGWQDVAFSCVSILFS